MACSTDKIKSDSLSSIRDIIKGKGNIVVSFTKNGDALITPSKESTKVKTMNSARRMAEQKIEKINKWSQDTFGTDAYTGQWATIKQSPTDFRIELTFPRGLEDLYRKKEAIEEARAVQQADSERAGEIYSDEYMFDYMPENSDGYNYGTYHENKKNMRNYISQRLRVLEEMPNKTKTDLEQIEEFKEIRRRLNKDLVQLENETNVLENFFGYFNNDLQTINDILLENPSLDNVMAARVFIENLKFVYQKGGFKNDKSYRELKESNPEHYNLFKNFNTSIGETEKLLDDTEDDITNNHVSKLLSKEKLDDNDDGVSKDYNELADKIEDVSFLAKNFLPIDGETGTSPLLKFVRKVYDDATGKQETYSLRQKLLNIQEKVENRLLELGYKNNDSFIGRLGSKVKYDIFYKGNNLINKFSENWSSFKKDFDSDIESIQDMVFAKEEFAAVKKERRKLFNKIKNDVVFVDVRKIPEFIERDDLQGNFGTFFKSDEAETHKEELIKSLMGNGTNREVAEKQYKKLIDEQLSKIHAFEISMDQYKNRLLKKNNVDTIQELSEKDRNSLLSKYYTESPFAFADNYESTGKSDVAKIYYKDGEQKQSIEPSTMEYISFAPKSKEFFDEEFEQTIESDDVLLEAWEAFDEAHTFVNNNRKYQQDGYNSNPRSLLYQYDMLHAHNQSLLKLGSYLPKKALDWIQNVFSTSKFIDPKEVNLKSSESIKSLDEVISSSMKSDLALLRTQKLKTSAVTESAKLTDSQSKFLRKLFDIETLPTAFIIDDLLFQKHKAKVLEKQNLNMIDALTSQLETVELFKAKKQIETIMLFAKNQIERVKKTGDLDDKKNAIKLVSSFINRHLYGVNNRANWVTYKQNERGWNVFNSSEREAKKETLKAINLIKELSKHGDEATQEQAAKDIADLQALLDSGGRTVTTGSIFEVFSMRTAILVGLGLNLPSQIKNTFMGNLAGRQNDGIEWTEGNYVKAASYTRKWKVLRRKLSGKDRAKYKLTNTLINGLGVFQNSANELDRIKESSYQNNIGKFISNPLHIVGETEKSIQRPQILAVLGDVDIKDKNGNIVKAFNVEDIDNPHPAFQLDDEGNIVLKPEFDTEENRATWINRNSQEYANLFGESGIVPSTIARINGDYRSTSSTVVKETSVGSLLMLFKTWLPAFILRRYGKTDGVISNLGKSGRQIEAAQITALTASMYGAIGASVLVSPIVGIGMTAAYLGYQKHKMLMKEEGKYLNNLMQDIQKTVLSLQFLTNTVRLPGAVVAKLAQQSTDLVFGNRFISNDIINQIAGYEQKEGETDTEYEKNVARLNFLLAEASTTMTLLMLKFLANALLFPDDDEEKKYRDLNDDYIAKIKEHPSLVAYYGMENMLSGMASDMNLLNDPQAFLKTFLNGTSSSFITNWGNLLNSPIQQALEGDYKTGPNKDKNRIAVQFGKTFVPRGWNDFTLGFGNLSSQDYGKKDFINRIYMSDFKKLDAERKDQYNERKNELIEQYRKDYPYKDEEKIKKKAQKKAMKEFPSIKKYFNPDGSVKTAKEYKVEKYQKD